MPSIENVKVGDYVIVLDQEYREESVRPPAYEGEVVEAISPCFPGPLKIAAIAPPVLLCEVVGRDDEKMKGAFVDARHETWTKVGKRYVREFCRLYGVELPSRLQTKVDREKAKDDQRGHCPVCAEKLSERRRGNEWVMCCKDCQKEFVPIGEK